MKRSYEQPEIEIIDLKAADIIRTSGETDKDFEDDPFGAW